MGKLFILILGVALILSTLGCQNTQTRATEGAVIGGLVGAAAGGIIGHQSGHGGEGAGIGAAVGALSGAVIGSQINKPGQTSQGTTGQANPNQLTMQQIVDMSKQGVNEAVIIDKIRLSNSRFTLTAADIGYLKQQGVSQAVIAAMQGS